MHSKKIFAGIASIVLMLGIVACQPKLAKPVRAPESAPIAAPTQTEISGAKHYQVDSAASELHVLVYRGGAMARLGHNHVVSSKAVSGDVFLHADLSRSQIALTLPVATVSVDDPQVRATEGDEFSAEVPQEARDGTRRNLLRPEVLDPEHYPVITLQSAAIVGTRNAPQLMMRITIKGISRDVPVSVAVQEDGSRLIAVGEFAVKQTDFGMTPFSVALGALQVVDTLRIKFKIVAVAQN